MEHYIVLADKIDYTAFPDPSTTSPHGSGRALGVGKYIPWGVKPHIEHLALGPFNRHRHAPVEITAHGRGCSPHVEPRLALTVDIGPPSPVAAGYPTAQVIFPRPAADTSETSLSSRER